MPPLRGLSCTLALAGHPEALPEHSHQYRDSFVESWLEVQDKCLPLEEVKGNFCISLSSDEYIAPGLAMFIYIDGVYQCNKAIMGLEEGSDGRASFSITALGHQTFLPDGSMVEKPWRFQRVPEQGFMANAKFLPFGAKYAGTIDIIVKRIGKADGATTGSPFRMPPGGLEYFAANNQRSFQHSSAGWKTPSNSSWRNPWTNLESPNLSIYPFSDDARTDCFPPSAVADNPISEPIDYAIPQMMREQHRITLSVHLDKSVHSLDQLTCPKFLDPPGKSFAIFHFKYRDTTTLEQILQLRLRDPEHDRELDRLAALNKEALVREIMALKIGNTAAPAQAFQSGQQINPGLLAEMKQVIEDGLAKQNLDPKERARLLGLRAQLNNMEQPNMPMHQAQFQQQAPHPPPPPPPPNHHMHHMQAAGAWQDLSSSQSHNHQQSQQTAAASAGSGAPWTFPDSQECSSQQQSGNSQDAQSKAPSKPDITAFAEEPARETKKHDKSKESNHGWANKNTRQGSKSTRRHKSTERRQKSKESTRNKQNSKERSGWGNQSRNNSAHKGPRATSAQPNDSGGWANSGGGGWDNSPPEESSKDGGWDNSVEQTEQQQQQQGEQQNTAAQGDW